MYKPNDSRFSATFAVSNLANRYYYYGVIQGSLNAQTVVAPPREFSLTVRRTF
jgi:outer membrane receptor protein involved in Fe transport